MSEHIGFFHASNRITVHIAGLETTRFIEGGKVEIDVVPSVLPSHPLTKEKLLLYDEDADAYIMPHHFCGLRIIGASEFLWLDESGNVIEEENHGDVRKKWEHYALAGIEFTGPITSYDTDEPRPICQGNPDWVFHYPLIRQGDAPPPRAAQLVIDLGQAAPSTQIEFIDKSQQPMRVWQLYQFERWVDRGKLMEQLDKWWENMGKWLSREEKIAEAKEMCKQNPEWCQEVGGVGPAFPVPIWRSSDLCKQYPSLCEAMRSLDKEKPQPGDPSQPQPAAPSRARHALSEARYQTETSEVAKLGSMPDWIDFYNVGSDIFINVIYRPAQTGWLARHGLSGKQYQELYDEHVKNGPFRLHHVDSYVEDGQIKYAVVLVRGSSANMPAYHGLTAGEHQAKFNDLTSKGFVPVNMSVTSLGGQRRYVAFYEKKTVGGVMVKTSLTAKQYQTFVNEQVEAKREIAYLKSYTYNGNIHYSAIFYGNIDRPQVLRHGMSSAEYQREFDKWVGQGFALKMVTAAARGNTARFAAVWQK